MKGGLLWRIYSCPAGPVSLAGMLNIFIRSSLKLEVPVIYTAGGRGRWVFTPPFLVFNAIICIGSSPRSTQSARVTCECGNAARSWAKNGSTSATLTRFWPSSGTTSPLFFFCRSGTIRKSICSSKWLRDWARYTYKRRGIWQALQVKQLTFKARQMIRK